MNFFGSGGRRSLRGAAPADEAEPGRQPTGRADGRHAAGSGTAGTAEPQRQSAEHRRRRHLPAHAQPAPAQSQSPFQSRLLVFVVAAVVVVVFVVVVVAVYKWRFSFFFTRNEQNNQIQLVRDDALSGLQRLQWLDLSDNNLATLDAGVFRPTRSLNHLDLRSALVFVFLFFRMEDVLVVLFVFFLLPFQLGCDVETQVQSAGDGPPAHAGAAVALAQPTRGPLLANFG